MLVSQLKESVADINEEDLDTHLGDMSLDEEARTLTVGFEEGPAREFQFDAKLERSLSKYLGISTSYLAKCSPDLKAYNVNHWLKAKGNAAAVVQTIGEEFASIHRPGLIILPMRQVADVITNVFEPDNEIIDVVRSETRFMVDIKTNHHVEVPTNDAIEDRRQGERAIGDITHGGIRMFANPTELQSPVVQRMLYRLWCTNGSTSPEAEGTISLKGKTIDVLIPELEAAARQAMSQLDQDLASYADLANRYPPGSKEAFARQLGVEHSIPARVMSRILDRIEILPAEATLYDIQQVFTEVANGNLPFRTRILLQGLAGNLAMNTDHVVHRCTSCERLLPE